MKVKIEKSIPEGKINAVPSKSYAHRLLLASALSNKPCTVSNVKLSNDIKATLNCIASLGRNYLTEQNEIKFLAKNQTKDNIFNCLESGSTLRFIIPIALAFCEKATFIGTERLIERGIGVYEDILKGQVEFIKGNDRITAKGKIKSGTYKIKGNVSSQFITGMMFALPLLKGDSLIKIIPPFESKDYVNITLDVLNKFGIRIKKISERKYKIYGNQEYKAVDSVVEGDWSNGAFMHALSCLGGKVEVKGLIDQSLQGDKKCVEIFNKLSSGYKRINLENTPDLAPIAFAVAGAKYGAKFIGTRRLKIKESDRAEVMKQELKKFGIGLKIKRNSVKVSGKVMAPPTELLSGHNDHRIVMALSILLTLTGGEIDGVEAVSKSYVEFFEDLKSIGIGVIESA